MDIIEFNPWWKTGRIDREIKSFKRRFLFTALKNYLHKKQIDIIIGLRRVGKTVLMHHLILYFDSCFSEIHCLWAFLSVNKDVGTTFSSITLGGTLMPTALKAR